MPIIKEIFTRTSVRQFTGDAVDDAAVEQLLRAAMQAPSAMNQQPWEFVVVKDRAGLDGLMRAHQFAAALKSAGCAVVVCGRPNTGKTHYPFWVQDCSAAAENILLEAVHLNLGAVWLGVYPVPRRVAEVAALLHTPEDVTPFCIIAVGHPAIRLSGVEERFDATRVHRETW